MLSNESQYVLAHRCLSGVKDFIMWSTLHYVAFLIIYYTILLSYFRLTQAEYCIVKRIYIAT